MSGESEQWLAERYAPGFGEDSARALFDALRAACSQLVGTADLQLVDATWLPDDELLTARFVGTRSGVVAAHELAGASFDRLTRAVDLDS